MLRTSRLPSASAVPTGPMSSASSTELLAVLSDMMRRQQSLELRVAQLELHRDREALRSVKAQYRATEQRLRALTQRQDIPAEPMHHPPIPRPSSPAQQQQRQRSAPRSHVQSYLQSLVDGVRWPSRGSASPEDEIGSSAVLASASGSGSGSGRDRRDLRPLASQPSQAQSLPHRSPSGSQSHTVFRFPPAQPIPPEEFRDIYTSESSSADGAESNDDDDDDGDEEDAAGAGAIGTGRSDEHNENSDSTNGGENTEDAESRNTPAMPPLSSNPSVPSMDWTDRDEPALAATAAAGDGVGSVAALTSLSDFGPLEERLAAFESFAAQLSKLLPVGVQRSLIGMVQTFMFPERAAPLARSPLGEGRTVTGGVPSAAAAAHAGRAGPGSGPADSDGSSAEWQQHEDSSNATHSGSDSDEPVGSDDDGEAAAGQGSAGSTGPRTDTMGAGAAARVPGWDDAMRARLMRMLQVGAGPSVPAAPAPFLYDVMVDLGTDAAQAEQKEDENEGDEEDEGEGEGAAEGALDGGQGQRAGAGQRRRRKPAGAADAVEAERDERDGSRGPTHPPSTGVSPMGSVPAWLRMDGQRLAQLQQRAAAEAMHMMERALLEEAASAGGMHLVGAPDGELSPAAHGGITRETLAGLLALVQAASTDPQAVAAALAAAEQEAEDDAERRAELLAAAEARAEAQALRDTDEDRTGPPPGARADQADPAERDRPRGAAAADMAAAAAAAAVAAAAAGSAPVSAPPVAADSVGSEDDDAALVASVDPLVLAELLQASARGARQSDDEFGPV